MDLGLKDRVALVTGSSQGIGRATAELFGREGARVAVTYRNNRDKAEEVAENVRKAGGDAMVLFYDLSSVESIKAAVKEILAKWGRVDILVNNAVQWGPGATITNPPKFEEQPLENWIGTLRPNIEGAFASIQEVLPSMRERRWGRIVNVSSGLAVSGVMGSAAYSAAKAALHGLTRTLYKELGPEGILTNVVMAGLTLTDTILGHMPKQRLEQYAQSAPLRRLPTPEEVGTTIVFLSSAANTLVNGEIILASGGHA